MKKYIIEFTYLNGETEELVFETDRGYDWTIQQFSRNRSVANHKLISESSTSSKKMLFD
jgi:hypothetical protein|tara:strand:+ start:601 stop:777 length:177 start_codon:yes stop_codon:yes gene_type:complete